MKQRPSSALAHGHEVIKQACVALGTCEKLRVLKMMELASTANNGSSKRSENMSV